MQSWTKRDFFTHLVLFILLFVRFSIADFASFIAKIFNPSILSANIENFRLLQDQTDYLYFNYSFILVLVVIIVNRNNLKELNIDKVFILILLSGGLSYHWGINPTLLLVVISLMLISVAILYVKGWLKFGDVEPNLLRITLVVVIAFFLGLLFIIDSMNFGKIGWIIWWYKMTISGVIVEEVAFRGLLWAFLKKLNFSEFKIVALQAILFWLSHTYLANKDPFFFWVITPIGSIILGIIVWRTRSITSSATAHMLFNIWWGLFEMQMQNL